MPAIKHFAALAFAAAMWAQTPSAPPQLVDGLEKFHAGDLRGAEKSFRALLASGDNPTARAFLALSLAGTGRCEQAVPELRIQASNASDAELRRLAGLALLDCDTRAGRFAGAFQEAAALQAMNPSDADTLYETARLYNRAWNETLRELFERAPASFRVNQLSAEIFESQANYTAAITEYRKAIAKSPATIGLHYRLGRAILMQSHSPEAMTQARAEFDAELQLNPTDAAAQYEVAEILIAQQHPEEAAARLEMAIQDDPDFPEALITLARLRSMAGRNREAIPLLERAVKLAPRSQSARMSLMLAYRKAGRLDDAKAQKEALEKLVAPPGGEFSDFLKRLGETNP
jgi:tetratricopeptide (TPR) repeat protein